MSKTAQERLQQAFLQISHARTRGETQGADKNFREAFLDFGSETPDNVQAMSSIAVKGVGPESDTGFGGLALSRSGNLLSEILNEAEGCDIPNQVRVVYPELAQAEWDAVLRVATMALISFEAPPAAYITSFENDIP